ncbi:MAG: cytochrome c5 family protein [Gammaproteobacteria bacterium]|jgi:cytochrome c5|nr:cytochrome c5 family protein [Gammaproteobacteria bacterium]|tara:strand:- start:551 stop:961 length:411 start_codon:yes stop_codon:yes gene_type:complete
MKKFIPLFVVTLAVVLFFNGKKYDELVTSRLSTSIAVCLEGESCGQATAMKVASAGEARSADSIYTTGCAACHDSGVAGAPMMGNQGQWEARQAKGYEMLVDNAWNGINGMPAKGLCADCTKEEIGIAVQYMLDAI